MKKSSLHLKGFRWVIPVAFISVMAIGCGSAETPAEETPVVEEVAPATAAPTDSITNGPDTTNMPIDTGAAGKPPVNRK